MIFGHFLFKHFLHFTFIKNKHQNATLCVLVFTEWKAGRIKTLLKMNNLLLNLHVTILSVALMPQCLMVV